MSKKLFIFIIVLYSSITYAQKTTAIVEYKAVINETYVDSFLTDLENKEDVPKHIKDGVKKMYKEAIPDEYILNIKNGESYFYYEPKLDIETSTYNVGSKAGKNAYFTNKKNDIFEYSPSLGNIILKKLDWKITKDSKKIGEYTCFKATATEKLFSRQGFFYNREVTAWFTPVIPLSFGPKYYNGLPGLVLRIERDLFTITATSINLNPEDKKIKIKKLKDNDKVITQEESYKMISDYTESIKENK
ncbi:GLPGLI family protein [Zunongwangia atlantica]|uniref:GLPGLI family protein n=1 Tax=Zunongwangia atlantica 22II14-10F7 TaxID=1185767 RepID=A0A1Y1T2T4_9FLAO|nr:GLPGLI family protein [Zunongwangia atlantica]ORL45092.1 hypothetical protein IIF7_11592 [Zunongwangia atlantica 22II14-10F7]